MSKLCTLLFGTAGAVALTNPVFPDSAVFERLQHFKDVGLPNTLEDPFNRAAIADGTCRVVTGAANAAGGFACWHSNAGRVDKVLAALGDLPSSDAPSKMTLAAKRLLPAVCAATPKASDANTLSFYNASVAAGSMQAWFRALCDKSWDDPAYQPQQAALTVGFACAISCDAAARDLDAADVDALQSSLQAVKDSVGALCAATPYSDDRFANLDSFDGIAKAASAWRGNSPCLC